MAREYSRVRIGLFVITGLFLVLAAIIWLGSQQVFTAYDRFYTYFTDSVSGLEVSSTVKFRGVSVGRVADIRIDPEDSSRVEVSLDLRPDTPIKQDMMAELRLTGITGIKYVELMGGAKDATRMPPSRGLKKSIIPSRSTLLDKVDEQFQELYVRLTAVIRNLEGLTEEGSRQRLADTLDGIARLSGSLSDTLEALQPGLHQVDSLGNQAAQLLTTTEDEIKRVGSTARDGIEDAAALVRSESITDILDDFRKTAAELRAFSENLNRQLARVDIQGTGRELRQTLDEIQLAARNLNDVLAQLKQNPSALVLGKPRDERPPVERRRER
ncbi:MCE family protein [bacterium]|nr:MCE family protein [candidate division CSSED10-310 bacterium]